MDLSPTISSSYKWFFNLGIFLVISKLLLYSTNINTLPYFGLLLISIGYFKFPLYKWVFIILWIFVFLDVVSTLSVAISSIRKINQLVKDPKFK